MHLDWTLALLGGCLIGGAVSLFYLLMGRVAGISGIFDGALSKNVFSQGWRWAFVLGLVSGGALMSMFWPQVFFGDLEFPDWTVVVGGLLVGFGTRLGGGCTSGHGVCGNSRLSLRSGVATVTFIATGVLTVICLRQLGRLL